MKRRQTGQGRSVERFALTTTTKGLGMNTRLPITDEQGRAISYAVRDADGRVVTTAVFGTEAAELVAVNAGWTAHRMRR